MDTALLSWFSTHRTVALDALAVFLTVAGRAGLMFALAAIVRGFSNRKLAMAAWQVVLAAVLATLVSDAVLKPIVHRPRPFTANPALAVVGTRPESASFPSGHAASSVAGALALASTWPQARVAIWAAAALVALSRVYLGVHYPTDVLGGALVGLLVGWFVLGSTVWRWREATAARGTRS